MVGFSSRSKRHPALPPILIWFSEALCAVSLLLGEVGATRPRAFCIGCERCGERERVEIEFNSCTYRLTVHAIGNVRGILLYVREARRRQLTLRTSIPPNTEKHGVHDTQ